MSQVGLYLHWPHWWDKWPIDTILPSNSSSTLNQIIYKKLKLVTNWCKPFQIRPQTIVIWTRYATNYFFGYDYGITMFHWVSLNCKTMNIRRWCAPFNSPHTIPTHKLLNLQPLKSQNKCFIFNNPIGLANINIWTYKATWHCVNSRFKKIHMNMFVWIAF